jgi:hypothetical protein
MCFYNPCHANTVKGFGLSWDIYNYVFPDILDEKVRSKE